MKVTWTDSSYPLFQLRVYLISGRHDDVPSKPLVAGVIKLGWDEQPLSCRWSDNSHDAYPEIQHQNSCQVDKHPKQKTVIWPVTRILPPRRGIFEEMSVRWDLDVCWTSSSTHGFR